MANFTPFTKIPITGTDAFESDVGTFLQEFPERAAQLVDIANEVVAKANIVDVSGSATLAATAASQASRSATRSAASEAGAKRAAESAAADAATSRLRAQDADLSANQSAENAIAAAEHREAAEAAAALADSAGNATAAQTARTGAETAEANAEAAQTKAEEARDLAKNWATQIGSQVVAGQGYSAQHHATAAAASARDADASKTAAAASATQAAGYAGLMLAASTSDSVIRLNPRSVTADLLIPSGFNAGSAGPLVIADRVTVTVSNHSTWSIQ
jgi:hypothetical protein